MLDFWHSRWQNGQTGWHEADGNVSLQRYWPQLAPGSRVLVPLCGKSADLLWLVKQGCQVVGVELSEIAARSFFEEAGLSFETNTVNGFKWFECSEADIAIACGNYFEFTDSPFDALYDRAALVALPPKLRPEYIQHTRPLLKQGAFQLLITLECDAPGIEGPPFSVMPDEVAGYWPDLQRIAQKNDIENSPPRFREAGVKEVLEVVWISPDTQARTGGA